MGEETSRFVAHVLTEGDGTLRTLLTGRFSFARGPLYALYGAQARGDARTLQRVDLPAVRLGVLTHPSVLTVHAHADQTRSSCAASSCARTSCARSCRRRRP